MNGTTTNTVAVLKKIAEITGVPIVTTGLTAISMKVPKGYSCREVLSYVAQLYGAFAVCNRIGQIELHTYVDSAYKIGAGRYWGNFEHNDYAFNVTRMVCATGENKNGTSISITAGSGTRSISLSNPFMTQAVLNKILASFQKFLLYARYIENAGRSPTGSLGYPDRNRSVWETHIRFLS